VNCWKSFTTAIHVATDIVDGQIASIASGNVDTSVIGVYTLSYNYTDVAGNVSAQVTRTVNVASDDIIKPVILLIGNPTINLAVGDNYTELGATASDDTDGDISANIIITSDVNTAAVGTYSVNYNVQDASGNAAIEVTRTVNMMQIAIDIVKPVITLMGDADINLTVGDNYVELGATALDDTDGNIAVQVTRTIIVTEVDIPVITLIGNDTINVTLGDDYVDMGATAIDGIDGNISASIVINSDVDTTTVGRYSVNYNVQDSDNNLAMEVTRTVIVVAADTGGNSSGGGSTGIWGLLLLLIYTVRLRFVRVEG